MNTRTYTLLFLIFTLVSCGNSNQKDVVINATEAGVYYDLETEAFVTLTEGKHSIPKSSQLFTYPLSDVSLKEEVRFKSKDKKRLRATIVYEYRPKVEGMEALHSKEGKYYEDMYVKPAVFSKVRNALNVLKDSISEDVATKKVKVALSKDEVFSKRIETLTFKITDIVSEE